MTTVYVVMTADDLLAGVYTTRELAQAAIDRDNKGCHQNLADYLQIHERQLDEIDLNY